MEETCGIDAREAGKSKGRGEKSKLIRALRVAGAREEAIEAASC